MSLSVLIVTPQRSFGEHIRQILEETYPSHVVIVDDVFDALEVFQEQNFTHAFLDTALRNSTVRELGLALRKIAPGLRLILVSGDPAVPSFETLQPWTLLPKPFYVPDLLRIIDDEAGISVDLPAAKFDIPEPIIEDASSVPDGGDVAWLQDVSKAAQHLTRLTLESSAQAALITRRNNLWAYSGQLSQPAAQELVGIVSNDKKTGDLLKFIRLETTQAEHMLYATELAEGINLAMVFDAETPFSTIRSQATHLADSLSLAPQPEEAVEPPPVAVQQKEDEALHALFDFGEGDEEDLPPLTEILENIPDPNPVSAAAEVKASPQIPIPSGEQRQRSPLNEPMPNPFSQTRPSTPIQYPVNSTRESSPAMHLEETRESNVVVEETRPNISQSRPDVNLGPTRVSKSSPRPKTPVRVNQVDLAATRVSNAIPRPKEIDLNATRVSKAQEEPEKPAVRPEELSPARPHSITEVAGRVLAEPGSAGLYDLTYACLLLPRFGSHHLAGDLADRISEWMPSVSVAFGWRLEYISVRPDYLQWVINVPPTTSPGYLMRIIRKQTSDRIFDEFPRLKRENPSGDFWAPGYLIMGGSQPHPSKLVQDYIQRTREHQGML